MNQPILADDFGYEHDSPIETLFANVIFRRLRLHGTVVEPQYKIKQFRYDFAIILNGHLIGPQKPAVLIECDGKAFHSSPPQIANDERKNALAKFYGIQLLRFSGSQIYRDPESCAAEVLLAILRGKSK